MTGYIVSLYKSITDAYCQFRRCANDGEHVENKNSHECELLI